MRTVAERFFHLFQGLDRAHGAYVIAQGAKPNAKGKLEGAAKTEHVGPSVELWELHLDGKRGLGIVPIMDNNCCHWGAIDIDVYDGLDHVQLEKEVRSLKLPLHVCRTKSGGAHLYLFMREEAPATLVREKLMQWAVALGFSGVEVFPKQTRLASKNDNGNWINMPYFDGRSPYGTRYCIRDGKAIADPENFLLVAEGTALSVAELTDIGVPTDQQIDELLLEAPPCLQSLAKRGFPAGTRNNALFNMAVYLRKRYEDDWQQYLDRLNQRFMDPPLGHKEVAQIVKSVNKKTYNYRCADQPIASACNRQICLTREFGVGGGSDDPGVTFGQLIKLETAPPIWIWDVDGARIELTTPQLMDQGRFQARAIEELNKWPNHIKPSKWLELVRGKLEQVQLVPVPLDATLEGQVWLHLERFCTGKAQARSRDELLMGKPWTDPDGGRTYFCSSDFLDYLQRHRVGKIEERKLFSWFRKGGMEHHSFNLKGRFINCWSIPKFVSQIEEFDTPRLNSSPMKEGD